MKSDNNKCSECGQTIVPVFKAGDIVEHQGRIGVIPAQLITDSLTHAGHTIEGRQWVIMLETGHAWRIFPQDLKVVHGYLHIDREKF